MHKWTWATAGAQERGEWVRHSFQHCLGNVSALCELFNLTAHGAKQILDGDDWRPEYEQPAVNYIE